MNSKQRTLFQTWNKEDPGPSTSKVDTVSGKKGKTGGKKRNPWTKKPSNQQDDTSGLWKKNINIPSLQQDFAENVRKETTRVHAEFDVDAGKTWIYPTNYPLREYQFNIVKEALFKNTLVILPTGLGKTFIAAVVMYNMRRWYPNGKIVFMAPTRPLVAQQIDACFKIMGIPQDDTALMTGTMLPAERKRIWQTKHVFFLTPQILTNDLARNICSADSIKCLVVDEAHKALGNHAYCQVVKDLHSQTSQFRVLALTATPGGDTEAVRQVLENLLISHVELRTDDCNDIKPYTHERNVEKIVIPLGKELLSLKEKFLDIINTYLKRLNQRHSVTNRNPSSLSQFYVYKLREEFCKKPPPNINQYTFGLILADLSLCVSLYHAYELLLLHGVKPFYNFLQGILRGDKSNPHARAELQKNPDFEEIMHRVKENYALEEYEDLHQERSNAANTSGMHTHFVPGHPKLVKLKEIVLNHFQTAAVCDTETRAMIFSQYRDSVKEITEMLKGHEPLIRVMSFIGQSSSTDSKGGISQKQQLKIVSQFREGGYNTLVSTCVGEEGLDIGEVDLIICYDAPKSPIRLVQRMGRTGRRRQGKIVVLLTEGKEEQMYNSSQYKKKNIYRAIRNGFDQIPLYQNNPTMIPNGIKPQCVKLFMEIEPKKLTLSKRELNKLRKGCPFLSEDEFQYFCKHYKAPDCSLPVLARPNFVSLLDKEQIKKIVEDEIFDQKESANTLLSVNSWMPWQNVLQPTYLVPHSRRTHTMVKILQLIGNPNADVKYLEYREGEFANFETLVLTDGSETPSLLPKARDPHFSSSAGDFYGDIVPAVADNESRLNEVSEISVIGEFPKKGLTCLSELCTPSVHNENVKLYSQFDFQVSDTDRTKLCKKDLKKVGIRPPPRATCDPLAINAQSILAFDVNDIIPCESKEFLLLSKIDRFFSRYSSVTDQVMDFQLDDDTFFDFAVFDLNFDHDSPPVLVSPSPKQVKPNEKSVTSSKCFATAEENAQKSSIAGQGNLLVEDTNSNPSPRKLVLQKEQENKDIPNVHLVDSTIPVPIVPDNLAKTTSGGTLYPIPVPAVCDNFAKTMCEQTQYSLTQLASLVDHSEMFVSVQKNVDSGCHNIADEITFNDDSDAVFANIDFDSDEDYVCPTPPQPSRSNTASTKSQLSTYQSTNAVRTRLSGKSRNVLDVAFDIVFDSKFPEMEEDILPKQSMTVDDQHNLQEINGNSPSKKLENITSSVQERVASDITPSAPSPVSGKEKSGASASKPAENRNESNDCAPLFPEEPAVYKNSRNFETVDDIEREFSQDTFSEKEFQDRIYFDIAFDEVEEDPLAKQSVTDNNQIDLPENNGNSPGNGHKNFTSSVQEHVISDMTPSAQSPVMYDCSAFPAETSPFKHTNSSQFKEACGGHKTREGKLSQITNNRTAERNSDSQQAGSSVVIAVDSSHKSMENKLSRNTLQHKDANMEKDKKNNNTRMGPRQVLSPNSDFDDFKIPSRPKKATPPKEKLSTLSSHVVNVKEIAKKFIISEADVSDMLHSGSDSASDDSILDQLEASFIDDSSFVDHHIDQHGLYLQSIKSHHGLPQKYKLQANPVGAVQDVYSQPTERELSCYLMDSFVVENDEVELLTSSDESVLELEKGRKKKRKRIIQPACSSSSEIEDWDYEGEDRPSKVAKFATNKPAESESVPRSSTPDAELLASDYDEFKSVPDVSSPPINALRKKRGCVKQLEMSQYQASELCYNLDEKSTSHNFETGNRTDVASHEKISFDISWSNNQSDWVPDDNSLELLLPKTSDIQDENSTQVQELACSQGSSSLTVLVDSKELASGKPIINALRNQFETTAVVMQLSGADYIISKELAVERLLETEFPVSPLHSKAVEKVQTMCQLYDRCCIIIEKDGRKQALGRKLRGKHLEFSLLLLLNTSVKVFYSESPENTAFLLFELAKQEKVKGLGISIPPNLLSLKKHILEFCSSLPHVSTVCSVNFAANYNSVAELLKCSVEDLQRVGRISRQRAYRLYNYFRASMKM